MHGFPPHFLRNWPLIRTHSHSTAQARRYKVFAALTVGSVQRMLLEQEGIPFLPDGRVDTARCLWDPGRIPDQTN